MRRGGREAKGRKEKEGNGKEGKERKVEGGRNDDKEGVGGLSDCTVSPRNVSAMSYLYGKKCLFSQLQHFSALFY